MQSEAKQSHSCKVFHSSLILTSEADIVGWCHTDGTTGRASLCPIPFNVQGLHTTQCEIVLAMKLLRYSLGKHCQTVHCLLTIHSHNLTQLFTRLSIHNLFIFSQYIHNTIYSLYYNRYTDNLKLIPLKLVPTICLHNFEQFYTACHV